MARRGQRKRTGAPPAAAPRPTAAPAAATAAPAAATPAPAAATPATAVAVAPLPPPRPLALGDPQALEQYAAAPAHGFGCACLSCVGISTYAGIVAPEDFREWTPQQQRIWWYLNHGQRAAWMYDCALAGGAQGDLALERVDPRYFRAMHPDAYMRWAMRGAAVEVEASTVDAHGRIADGAPAADT